LQQAIDGNGDPLAVQAVAQQDADGLPALQRGPFALGAIGRPEHQLILDGSGEPQLGHRQVGIEIYPDVERGAFAALTSWRLHQRDGARGGKRQRRPNEHRLARMVEAHRASICESVVAFG